MGEETLVAMPLAPHHHGVRLDAAPPHLAAAPPEDLADDGVVQARALPQEIRGLQPRPAAAADGGEEEEDVYYARKMMQGVVLRPPPHLPQPEAPPGLTRAVSTPAAPHRGYADDEEEERTPTPIPIERSASANSASAGVVDVASIGRFFRDRRDVLSSAINRRISSLKETSAPPADKENSYGVQEIHLPNVKVTVRLKEAIAADADEDDGYSSFPAAGISHIKGRVSFFSRSGCRDCAAVRAFFRQSGLPYVEINLDVFPEREPDLASRAGAAARVPQIFLNEKLLGGLVVLNSLRNSGQFERRVRDLAGRRCPDAAPRVPVYGFDVEREEEREDAMVGIVRVLRHRLPIQDRFVRVKLVKNCFSGADMVDGIVNHLECSRKKAVEIGKELARKHFIHHVFRENDFEDGGQNLYRFLEHDPAVPKYYNFRGATNDGEPKPAAGVGQRMTKIMVAILEAYGSDDRRRLDYGRVAASEEFRRYANLAQDLQRADVFALPAGERLSFFLNLHNAMAIHAAVVARAGGAQTAAPGIGDRRSFFADFLYVVGGYPYSLTTITNGVLRANRRQPYSIVKPLASSDKRLELAEGKVNPLVHFALCTATRSSPTVRFYSTQGVEPELRHAAREFLLDGGAEVDLETRTVYLTRIIKCADFGQDRDILRWILNYLDPAKAGLLTHLLNDGGPISIAYQDYDWSFNAS
ncbi:hypothetical protein BRADI_3g29080v3 [Brachypodium distachyon]|uniref:DEP domain-containing protein n=1 Tax=Brachypodium distachyon TaxID=15368 RepID=I1I4T3_BRADI|nr:hypothetical protein BRADI_3g29080v3 [Brachypodium distachyon]